MQLQAGHGHRSVTTTERHYAKWVKARQDRLDMLISAMWGNSGRAPRSEADFRVSDDSRVHGTVAIRAFMGSNWTRNPVCLLAEPLVSNRVAVLHKNVLRISDRSCGVQGSRSTGPGVSLPSKCGSNPPKNSSGPPQRESSAWHSLCLQPEILCQTVYGLGDLSAYELIMSRQVDVASGGGLCERREFSRRILPLRSAKRLLGSALIRRNSGRAA